MIVIVKAKYKIFSDVNVIYSLQLYSIVSARFGFLRSKFFKSWHLFCCCWKFSGLRVLKVICYDLTAWRFFLIFFLFSSRGHFFRLPLCYLIISRLDPSKKNIFWFFSWQKMVKCSVMTSLNGYEMSWRPSWPSIR